MNHTIKESVWVSCPLCGRKTHTKVYQDTVLVREALIKAHYNRVCRGNQRQQAKDEAILGGK